MIDVLVKEIRVASDEIWLTPIEKILHDSLFYMRLHQLPMEKKREYMDSIGAVIKKGDNVLLLITVNEMGMKSYSVTKPEYNPFPEIKANITKLPFDWNFSELKAKYNV